MIEVAQYTIAKIEGQSIHKYTSHKTYTHKRNISNTHTHRDTDKVPSCTYTHLLPLVGHIGRAEEYGTTARLMV